MNMPLVSLITLLNYRKITTKINYTLNKRRLDHKYNQYLLTAMHPKYLLKFFQVLLKNRILIHII